jgi:hypothetical protein
MKKPKQDPGVEITSYDYFKAAQNWHAFWAKQGKSSPSFPNFLGMSHGFSIRMDFQTTNFKMEIRASAAKKIEKLKGPYAYALLKAYQIRKNI